MSRPGGWGQPLGVVLASMIETESWHIHVPGHGEKGKETESRDELLPHK